MVKKFLHTSLFSVFDQSETLLWFPAETCVKKEKQLIYFFTFAVNYNLDSDDIAFTKTVLSIKPKSVNNRKAFHKPRKPW